MKRRFLPIAVLAVVLATAGLVVLGQSSGAPRDSTARPPVVILAFDEFPVDALRTPDGRIDAERFPNFARFARESTWWPNASASHDSTPRAFPPLLDGRRPRRTVKATVQGHPESVFTLFGERGYRVVSAEEATDSCPPRYCPGAAKRRLGILDNLRRNGREQRLERWMRQIRRRPRPAFYFKHVLLPHLPWLYLPSGRRFQASIGSLASPAGFHDRGLTVHNHERLLLQIGYVDRQLGRLVRRMKREGIYDEALIALTADHGIAFELGVKDRRKVSESNVDEVAPVPFFVKAPGQHDGAVNDAQVTAMDLVPTIADVLDVTPRWHVEGVSGFAPEAAERTNVRLPLREFNGFVTLPAEEMARRRQANMRHRARLFSTGAESKRRYGDPWASLYRSGPDSALVGRPAASIRRVPAGRARGEFVFRTPRPWSRVRPRSGIVPVQAAGHIRGGARGATREVAVAVNGRIRATGRTFYLRGPRAPRRRRGETFSLVFPERALHRGANSVELFEVLRRGRGLVLRALASS